MKLSLNSTLREFARHSMRILLPLDDRAKKSRCLADSSDLHGNIPHLPKRCRAAGRRARGTGCGARPMRGIASLAQRKRLFHHRDQAGSQLVKWVLPEIEHVRLKRLAAMVQNTRDWKVSVKAGTSRETNCTKARRLDMGRYRRCPRSE